MSDGGARLVDRGYRGYDGRRTGSPGAVRSVAEHGLRAVLGIGRPARHKALPIVAAALAYIPAMVFVGLAVVLPDDLLDPEEVASYADYYTVIVAALVLFAAFVAPDALTADRRTGMLSLYMSTPLTRGTYLLARSLAVVATLLVVTIGPPLLLLIGYSFEGEGPDGLGGWLGIFLRIVLSGLVVAVVYGGVSLGLASLTDRRAVASAAIVLVMLVSAALTTTLVQAGGLSRNWYLFNLLVAPFELVFRIYGERGPQPTMSTPGLWGANGAWIAVSWGTAWWRYHTMRVDR